MAFKLAEAFIEFTTRGRENVSRGISGLRVDLSGMILSAQAAIQVLQTVGRTVASAVTQALGALETQIQAEARLESVIRSTGGAAGFTAGQLKQMAKELQAVTNFGDETTIAAQAMLATFVNIKGDQFQGAIKAAQDMSTVYEQDLKSSIIQIGKALNDPIKGITALSRVGVQFTKEQRAEIANLVNAGKEAAAQQVILNELQVEFGGAAEAAASPFVQLGNRIGDVWERIGAAIEPIALAVVQGIDEMMTMFDELAADPAIQELGRQLTEEFVLAVKLAAEAMKSLATVFSEVLKLYAQFVTSIRDLAQQPLIRMALGNLGGVPTRIKPVFGGSTAEEEEDNFFRSPDLNALSPDTTESKARASTSNFFTSLEGFATELQNKILSAEDDPVVSEQKRTNATLELMLAEIRGAETREESMRIQSLAMANGLMGP